MANYTNEIYKMLEKITKTIVYQDRKGFYRSSVGSGFGMLEILTMRLIGEGGCSIKDIVRHFNINRNVVNTVVKSLIKNNIVTKDQNETDGRFQILELTPRGKEILDIIREEQNKEVMYMLANTSINEEKAILKFLSRYQEYREESFGKIEE